ncbi:MAG TPA: polysaccharide deacetylase family protein [Longimicrobiales bacterium]|nr:polysaccharide deacetylase family protein [Longimicrobiales bacterium]
MDARASGGQLSQKAAGTAAVHLDLDGARHIFRLHGWRYGDEHDPIFESGLRHALDTFDDAGVTATLFVIAEDLEDRSKRALIEEARQRGHEIASHSLTHCRLANLTRLEKQHEIAGSRSRIMQALGVAVDGFRAPDFSLDPECLELIADAGYAYDSSRIAASRRGAAKGMEPARAGAHRPLSGRDLIELPLPPHAPLPVPFHPSYSLVLGEWYFAAGQRMAPTDTGPFVLLFHLIDFTDPLPKALLSGWKQRLYTLSYLSGARKRAACRRMLERISGAFTISSTNSIVQSLRIQSENQQPVR